MNVTSPSLRNLERLQTLLDYEISSISLYVLSHFYFLFIFLATLAALAFTPFLVYVLYQNNKKVWLGIFVVIVLLPFITIAVLAVFVQFVKPLLFITLGLFYLYCFLLRFEVKNWCKEERHRREYLIKKKISERNKAIENLF